MAFADKKGIVVASPFKLQAESLLDVRQQVDTLTERDELVTIKAATAGLRVYVKETKKSYVYNGTSWDTLTIGGNAALTVTLNSGTTEGTNKFTYNGTAAKTVNITPSSIGAAAKSHTHASTDITGLPSKLPNPQPLRFTGVSSASYDGSSAVTVNIPVTSKVPNALVIKLNGGSTEGTNMFTFDGGAAKSINITPSTIGAAAATHTHNANQITGLTAGKALISDTNGHPAVSTVSSTELGYLAGVTSGIQSQLNGKAATNHTHNYAGSSSAGGAANSAVKLTTARTLNGVSFDGTANINIPNNYFSKISSAIDINSLRTYGEYFAVGGSGCKNIPSGVDNFYLRVFRCADGYTGQELYYNGKTYKRYYNGTSWSTWDKQYSASNKPTASEIGAAASSHTHTASQITGLPTSLKNPYALTFAGAVSGTYDGSKAVTITIPTTGATTKASLVVQLNGGTTEGTNQFTFNGGTSKTINITPSSIGAATSGHTHNVASTTANGFLKQLDGSTSHFMRGDGTWATPPNTTYSAFKGATSSAAGGTGLVPAPAAGAQAKYLRGDSTWQAITPSSIGAAASSHTHTSSQISDFSAAVNGLIPSTRPNPYAITFTGATTGTYDGSKAVTINIPTTGATSKESLVIKLNSGSTEGTNMFTFNGGTAKTVNITPSAIGAAAASHGTHVTYSAAAPKANGTASAGSANSVSRSDHVHPLQTTVSGNAGTATKLQTKRTINDVSFDGTANITLNSMYAESLVDKNVSLNNYNLNTGKPTIKWYTCPTDGGGDGITGRPNDTNKQAFLLKCESIRWASTTDYITKQTYIQGSTNTTYERYCVNGTWKAWGEVYTSNNKPTASEIGAAASSHNHSASNITSGTLPVARGGTGLTASPSLLVNLASTSAASVLTASPRPGITGTLPVSHGGTGATTALAANYNILKSATENTAGFSDSTMLAYFTGSPSASVGAVRKYKAGNVWSQWLKAKTDAAYAAKSHTHKYAGSSSAGGAANSANRLNGISLTGGSGNTTGYRLIATVNINAWNNYQGVFAVNSRHTGAGLLCISVGCNNSSVSFANGYSEIMYFGPVSSGNIISSDSFLVHMSSNGTKAYIFWKYSDYNITTIVTLDSDFAISNGTWMTSISTSTYGNRKATTTINPSSAHNHSASNITSGTLPVARGGTGATTALAANYNILNSATENTAGFSDSTMLAYFTGSPSASVGAVRKYKAGNIWNQWLNGKISASYAAKSHTHNYAGSSSAGGAANSVKTSLTVRLNGGNTEGTNKFTFNGSAAKTINITPGSIGAATSSHTHNYAGSSSAGGAANSANRVPVPVGTVLFAVSSSTTFFNSCFGGTWEIVGNIDAVVGNATTLTLYLFRKTKA